MTAIQTALKARPAPAFPVERIRADFPILKLEIDGKPLVYLDNAASSQMPQPVIDRMVRYQTTQHANVNRGVHYLSETATSAYEDGALQSAAFHQCARRPGSDLHQWHHRRDQSGDA